MERKYYVIKWPLSQELMEMEWFDECVLLNNEKAIKDFGSSAYLIPEERLKEFIEGLR